MISTAITSVGSTAHSSDALQSARKPCSSLGAAATQRSGNNESTRDSTPVTTLTIDYTISVDGEIDEDSPALRIASAFAGKSLEKVLAYLLLRRDPISGEAAKAVRDAVYKSPFR